LQAPTVAIRHQSECLLWVKTRRLLCYRNVGFRQLRTFRRLHGEDRGPRRDKAPVGLASISRAVKGSLSASVPVFRKDSASTAHAFCRKRHLCAGLRHRAARCSAKITQTFLTPLSPPGAGRSQQNAKIKICKIEISKIANRKNLNFENFHHNSFQEIDREIVSSKIAFLFSRSTARPSLLRLLVLHSQCARCILNARKQFPYEATTSTRLNSHGSEERTQEDTMNPMRRSPSLLVEI
jgi:hypothetical protein